MSPAATRDIRAAGLSLTRHAAALSGNGIRAGARIAAGAMPGYSQLGKGTIHGPSLDCSDASLDLAGAPAPALFHSSPSSLFPPGLMRRAVGSTCAPPSVGLDRQSLHDALRNSVQSLETHHPHSRSGWRNPPWAHDGTHGKTRLLPLDGASPCPRKRPVILPSQASEAVTFSRLPIGSRRPTSARTGLRDLRNVTAPRRLHDDRSEAFRDVEKTGVDCE